MLLAFIVAIISTVGSLFYSQIAGYAPCELCWYQRIFMYPQVVLLGIALWRKDRNIIDYSIALSLVGFFIALYQNYINYGGVSAYCQILGMGVSCTKRYTYEFGYITIPMMALTAFVLVIVFLWMQRMSDRKVS